MKKSILAAWVLCGLLQSSAFATSFTLQKASEVEVGVQLIQSPRASVRVPSDQIADELSGFTSMAPDLMNFSDSILFVAQDSGLSELTSMGSQLSLRGSAAGAEQPATLFSRRRGVLSMSISDTCRIVMFQTVQIDLVQRVLSNRISLNFSGRDCSLVGMMLQDSALADALTQAQAIGSSADLTRIRSVELTENFALSENAE